MLWYYEKDSRIFIRIKAQPNSKTNEIVGVIENQLKIKIAAQPVDNKANEMIISFFAKKLKVSKGKITVFKGLSSKDKILAIDGETFADFAKKIEAIVES